MNICFFQTTYCETSVVCVLKQQVVVIYEQLPKYFNSIPPAQSHKYFNTFAELHRREVLLSYFDQMITFL